MHAARTRGPVATATGPRGMPALWAVRLAAPASVVLAAVFADAVGVAIMALVCLGTVLAWRAPLGRGAEVGTNAVLLLAAWSSVWQLYERWGVWDLVVHLLATAVLAHLAGVLLARRPSVRLGRWPYVVVVTALGTSLAVVWEYLELLGNALVDPTVNVGYTDTVSDIAAGNVGALLAGILGASAAVADPARARRVEEDDPTRGPRDELRQEPVHDERADGRGSGGRVRGVVRRAEPLVPEHREA